MKPTRETQNEQTPRSTMSSEAQRIAIAEACGWKFSPNTGPLDRPWRNTNVPDWDGDAWSGRAAKLPDYLSDLNAMHAAEKVLTSERQAKYYHRSTWERFGAGMHSIMHRNEKVAISAPAAQRAEAFLRTMNLWTDGD